MAFFKYGMVVDGENYCPRPELARQFSKLVESGLNVVVQGERRMGKTSFVCEAIASLRGIELVYVDLYCVKTIEEFCRRVITAVSSLDRRVGFLRKTAQLISSLRPVLTIDRDTGAPQLTVDAKASNAVASVEEVMDMLSAIASKRRICVVFDEFQDILELQEAEVLLARLRAKIQFQNKTSHVFLGSVRNRMHEIFDSPKSPFFKSATSFTVGVIDPCEFKRFLSERFKAARRKVSDAALEIARANAELNGAGDKLNFVCADVFDFLPEVEKRPAGDKFDLIILDPPAFTKSSKTLQNAKKGYREVNYRAMKALPRGGFLATCSCSHFMTTELFLEMLRAAALEAGVSLKIAEIRHQAPDHPVLLNVPETDYLKFVICQVV